MNAKQRRKARRAKYPRFTSMQWAPSDSTPQEDIRKLFENMRHELVHREAAASVALEEHFGSRRI